MDRRQAKQRQAVTRASGRRPAAGNRSLSQFQQNATATHVDTLNAFEYFLGSWACATKFWLASSELVAPRPQRASLRRSPAFVSPSGSRAASLSPLSGYAA